MIGEMREVDYLTRRYPVEFDCPLLWPEPRVHFACTLAFSSFAPACTLRPSQCACWNKKRVPQCTREVCTRDSYHGARGGLTLSTESRTSSDHVRLDDAFAASKAPTCVSNPDVLLPRPAWRRICRRAGVSESSDVRPNPPGGGILRATCAQSGRNIAIWQSVFRGVAKDRFWTILRGTAKRSTCGFVRTLFAEIVPRSCCGKPIAISRYSFHFRRTYLTKMIPTAENGLSGTVPRARECVNATL